MDSETQSLWIVALVAVVAIVAIVIFVDNGASQATQTPSAGNIGGAAVSYDHSGQGGWCMTINADGSARTYRLNGNIANDAAFNNCRQNAALR